MIGTVGGVCESVVVVEAVEPCEEVVNLNLLVEVDSTLEGGLVCRGENCIYSPCLIAFWEITFRFYDHRKDFTFFYPVRA